MAVPVAGGEPLHSAPQVFLVRDADVLPRDRDDFILGVSSEAARPSVGGWGVRPQSEGAAGAPGLLGGRTVLVPRDSSVTGSPEEGGPGRGRGGWDGLAWAEKPRAEARVSRAELAVQRGQRREG